MLGVRNNSTLSFFSARKMASTTQSKEYLGMCSITCDRWMKSYSSGRELRKSPMSFSISCNWIVPFAQSRTCALLAMPKSAPEIFEYPSFTQAAMNHPLPNPISRIDESFRAGRRAAYSETASRTRESFWISANAGLGRSDECLRDIRRYTSATKAFGSMDEDEF